MAEKNKLKVYGTGWCPKSAMLANHLQGEWIDFEFYNVETDEAAAQTIRALYDGKLKFPTVIYGDKHLKNPSVKVLREFLREHQIES